MGDGEVVWKKPCYEVLLKVFAWVKQYLRFCVFFLILKSRRKKLKIRLQNLVQTKQKNLRVLHFFGVFCDPSSTFPSKTGKLQGSPEGVKRSQFFEPVVTMGLVPPGQSCTESFRRILGVEMVTGRKVGKCNDRDDCQKNLGFFCWGGGGGTIFRCECTIFRCEITFVQSMGL